MCNEYYIYIYRFICVNIYITCIHLIYNMYGTYVVNNNTIIWYSTKRSCFLYHSTNIFEIAQRLTCFSLRKPYSLCWNLLHGSVVHKWMGRAGFQQNSTSSYNCLASCLLTVITEPLLTHRHKDSVFAATTIHDTDLAQWLGRA